MQYRLEQRIHTLARNQAGEQWPRPEFTVDEVRFLSWNSSGSHVGQEGQYWLATTTLVADTLFKAWDAFSEELSTLVPKIATVSQCYTEYADQPVLILKEGYRHGILTLYRRAPGCRD